MIEQSLVVLKKKTLLEIFIDTVLILILITALIIAALSILIIAKKTIYPHKVPDIMGIKPFIVLTGSMEPNIKTGDLVLVKEVDIEQLKEGDIIAFRHTEEDVVLIHRIVGKETQEEKIILRTKGDNNQTEDKYNVDCEKIEGIYIMRFEQIGTIAMFIRSPEGLVISILAIISIFFLWQLRKSLKREQIINRRLKECEEVIDELKKEGI